MWLQNLKFLWRHPGDTTGLLEEEKITLQELLTATKVKIFFDFWYTKIKHPFVELKCVTSSKSLMTIEDYFSLLLGFFDMFKKVFDSMLKPSKLPADLVIVEQLLTIINQYISRPWTECASIFKGGTGSLRELLHSRVSHLLFKKYVHNLENLKLKIQKLTSIRNWLQPFVAKGVVPT